MQKIIKSLGKGALILGVLLACFCAYNSGLIGGLPPRASAETEDWAGHTEHTVSGSVATASIATIDSGSANQRCVAKSMYLAGGTAGIYTFFSGSTPTGANQIGQFYLAANTPVMITSAILRGGMATSSGTSATPLCCVGAGTLTYTIVTRYDQAKLGSNQ